MGSKIKPSHLTSNNLLFTDLSHIFRLHVISRGSSQSQFFLDGLRRAWILKEFQIVHVCLSRLGPIYKRSAFRTQINRNLGGVSISLLDAYLHTVHILSLQTKSINPKHMAFYNSSIVAVRNYDGNSVEVHLKLISLQCCKQQ